MNDTHILNQGLQKLGLDSSELAEELNRYLEQLSKWNKAFNLTAIREPSMMVTHHVLDSLSVLPYVQTNKMLDFGSGAGLPGIPLALAKPDLSMVLLDSNNKKTRFLQQMVIELPLKNCEVVHARVEQYEEAFEQIVCRAFSSLADIATKTAHLLTPKGEILAMKAQLNEQELEQDLGIFEITAVQKLDVPYLNADRHLITLKKR